jgi:hypothetical protein
LGEVPRPLLPAVILRFGMRGRREDGVGEREERRDKGGRREEGQRRGRGGGKRGRSQEIQFLRDNGDCVRIERNLPPNTKKPESTKKEPVVEESSFLPDVFGFRK